MICPKCNLSHTVARVLYPDNFTHICTKCHTKLEESHERGLVADNRTEKQHFSGMEETRRDNPGQDERR